MSRLLSGIVLVLLTLGMMFALRYAVSENTLQEGTVLRFIPSSTTVEYGETFTVALVVENVVNLAGLEIQFRWNSTHIAYRNHTFTVPVESYQNPIPPSPYPGVLHNPIFILKDVFNTTDATSWHAVAHLGVTGFNGNGTILVVTFEALNEPGLTYLEFMRHDLADVYASLIAHEAISGAVNTWGLGISIISPENKTYNTHDVPLTFTIDGPPVWIGYSLDGAANVTIAGNTTIAGVSEGPHHVVICANSTDGKSGRRGIHFSVDTTPPVITLISPENRTYPTDTVSVVFVADEPISWSGLSVDGSPKITAGNTTLVDLSEGTHFVQVYANDTAGNIGSSSNTYFTVDTAPPTFEAVSWIGLSPYPYVPSPIIRAGEPALVTATITDPSGVPQVTICYRVDNGSWWNGTMTYNSTDSLWTCTLPGQIGEQTVEFFITAYDTFEQTASTPLYSYDTYSLLIGDVDGDGDVDIFDIVKAAGNYGKTLP